MFDMAKLTGLVGDLFHGPAEQPGLDVIAGQLGALGIDPATLEGMDPQQILDTLQAQGVDLSNFDTSELLQLGSETGLDSIMPGLIERITDRAA